PGPQEMQTYSDETTLLWVRGLFHLLRIRRPYILKPVVCIVPTHIIRSAPCDHTLLSPVCTTASRGFSSVVFCSVRLCHYGLPGRQWLCQSDILTAIPLPIHLSDSAAAAAPSFPKPSTGAREVLLFYRHSLYFPPGVTSPAVVP